MNRFADCLSGFFLTAALLSSPGQPQKHKPGDLRIEPGVFKAANGETVEAESGVLYVPENRRRAHSRLIELSFMRLKSRGKNPGAPTLYLVGGPGGQAIAQVKALFPLYSNLLEAGDLILLDQRGTGTSNPNLACAEKLNYPLDKPLEREELLRLTKEASLACARAWREKGVDLDGYNTLENADDVEALRQALKIERLNLFGTSYGTHLALAVIRLHGAHLNRVILAGVEGPDQTYKLPSQIDKNFEEIAARVRADPKIGQDMPDMAAVIRAIADRLGKNPVAVEVTDPATKDKVEIVLGEFDFQLFLASFAGRVARIKTLPASLDAMSQGDFSELARLSLAARREAHGSAMSFMMDCSSGVSAARWERIKREAHDSLAGAVVDFPFPEVCAAWDAPDLGGAFRSPVDSTVPTLFISGDLDGRTPVNNAEEVRRGFPNSHHLIVENAGHVDATMFTAKTKEVMVDFLLGKPVTVERIPAPPLEFSALKKIGPVGSGDAAEEKKAIIRYVVRPDPEQAAVEVRATVRLDDHRPYLKDFGQLAAIRWFVDGMEIEVKSERVRDSLVFTGLPHSGEAEAVYTLKVVTKAAPGYRKRLMGGPGYLMAREGLFLGKEQDETRPVEVAWELPSGWSLVLGSPGIQRFDRTQKGLWIAGKTLEAFEESIERRILRGAILDGVTKIEGRALRRALTAVFKAGLERFGPARLPAPAGLAETYGVVVFPDGTIGGGTALGFDLASEESLPTIVHEMIHWWTNRNVPAWFREGVHSYISVKLMAELGLITTEEFRKSMKEFDLEHVRIVKREGGLLTLEQSSKRYDQGKDGGDMYGAMPLLAFKLDREIQASNPKADLGMVFAEVCRRRPASVDIMALIKLRTGYDPEPLFKKYFYAPIAHAAELLR